MSTLVWNKEMVDWQPAESLPEFADLHPVSMLQGSVAEPYVPSGSTDDVSPYAAPRTEVAAEMPGYHIGLQPPTYLVQSIILTVLSPCCCCIPFGVIPLVYSILVSKRFGRGDVNGSLSASNTAKTWCLVLWILLGVVLFLRIIGSMFGAISYNFNLG